MKSQELRGEVLWASLQKDLLVVLLPTRRGVVAIAATRVFVVFFQGLVSMSRYEKNITQLYMGDITHFQQIWLFW